MLSLAADVTATLQAGLCVQTRSRTSGWWGGMTRIDEYKEWVAGVFDRSSASYDRVGPRFFTYSGRGLVEFSGMSAG